MVCSNLSTMYSRISNPEKANIKQTEAAISIFVHYGNAIKDNQENSKKAISRPHGSVAGHSQLLSNTYRFNWSLYNSISTDFSSD
ncbi:hypothetical protein DICPUDRAFT_148909 [Dictyostelium purpureum]|uniref:Uncharacterized protein n=1 Tax=Dictyostelium purpureum TaxID=5786 RepID=F0ZCB2_DICPU|nr:uncharacterized protein DICPUDRAFT_148909 [Dictyostelium purpureum]EGC38389.1 hypothetical protein DICPUDRAFT_148909 [Dictyostelium purpureum]|eukprot:XP_003285050.1 hypothetical protein DICPUDRAFT_148909 [Dictyostelium purpureum]